MTKSIRNYLTFLSRCVRIAFVGDWRYYLWVGALGVVCLLGLNAYAKQFVHGLVVTGMPPAISKCVNEATSLPSKICFGSIYTPISK